ncbi:hypothetical protein [Dactylosporangium sp. CS-033363]|uniref:hypothetical protein n=1 Tax=Dactylosporangium sp. CS-033363 TaxID=3239935 RepID=UPI003D8B7BD8
MRTTHILLAALLSVVWVAASAPGPAFAADTVQLTVSLYRVQELHCDEGDGESCGNDYYPKFELDGQGLYDGSDDFCCAHGSDFNTNWTRTATVDMSRSPVDIHLELWDQDDASQDDVIHWVNGGDYLDLKFDLNTCIFTGGNLTTQQGANLPTLAGVSEGSGADSARGYFSITTPACLDLAKTTDSDGDGIMNAWETPGRGLDVNNDGTVDLALGDAPYNATPWRKDLFVEADWMAGHKPDGNVLPDVVKAFNEAPIDPKGNTGTDFLGINLHASLDEEMPIVFEVKFSSDGPGLEDDFNDLKAGNPVVMTAGACSGHFGTAADRASPNCVNILNAKRQVYRYMIFANSYSEAKRSSGRAEYDSTATARGGNDFIVTLGSAWDADDIARAGGKRVAEASTFMHEFGHTLGLGHGGNEDINCKPNYLSIMNYTLQFPTYDTARPMDYASAARGTALLTKLDEGHLNETKGVYNNPNRNLVYAVGGKERVVPATNVNTDWNGINGSGETDVAVPDINWFEAKGDACPQDPVAQQYSGYDDWAGLQYNPRLNTTYFADGDRPGGPQELTVDDLRRMTQKADLAVTKAADQATATGGDTLTYTVGVRNLGPGPASGITLTDTMPDGTTQQRTLADLGNGASTTVAPKFSYLVPCGTPDGTTLTNRISVDGTDSAGIPDPLRSDNTASATTVIRAPKLTVRSSATATADAAAPITETVVYANTGGGAASGVAVTATVPAGLYYSTALDQGAGPKPSTVTLNADGSRTLTWNVGTVPANSGDRTIAFTVRSSLLAATGTAYPVNSAVRYSNATAACTFTPVTAAATTTLAVTPSTRNAVNLAWWTLHPSAWTPELLARIQATDQRYDTNKDGALSTAEATAAFRLDVFNPVRSVLGQQLLTTYLNLASKRVNAATAIRSVNASLLHLSTVGGAVTYAGDTLALPVTVSTTLRYTQITAVLDGINNNIIEVY